MKALIRAYRHVRAVSAFWTSPGRYAVVVTASGHLLFHREVDDMIRIPFHEEGELAKAVRQDRAARAAAEESSRRESGC
ncbi:hypothetical protein [Nonomuraea sp. NPDC049784]|uniref:hypothetical protein n=1 Tax=Nonomuraea sp. NPDC049784 TaxID=3154361 RepID=UPI0033C3F11D